MKHYIYMVYNTADITTHGNTHALIKIGQTANPSQRLSVGNDIRKAFKAHDSDLFHCMGSVVYEFENDTANRLGLLMEANLRKSVCEVCHTRGFDMVKDDYIIINTADLRRLVEGFATLGAMVERDSREPSLASLFF